MFQERTDNILTRFEGVGRNGNTLQDGRREETFREGLRRLQAFVDRHGHARVHSKYRDPDGYALGTWVWVRRKMHRLGRLEAHHARQLEGLPGWVWVAAPPDQFPQGLRALTTFARREGCVWVPPHHVEGGFPLGAWVRRQRAAWRKGKLAPAKREALKAVPHWTPKGPPLVPWLACLSEKLTDFARLHGHLRIPVTGPWALTAKRAAWVRQQHRAGRLTNDIMSQLERVPGWAWEPRETAFAQGLQAFRAFSRREGHGRVPEGHREGGVYLLPWVRRQRLRYENGLMSTERIRALEHIPHWSWHPEADRWARGLDALRVFAARRGHARPDLDADVRGLRLGVWVRTARARYRRGTLSASQLRDLEGIPGWTWPPPRDPATRASARRRSDTAAVHARSVTGPR